MTASSTLHPLVQRHLEPETDRHSAHRYLTEELIEIFNKAPAQPNESDPLVIAKYFMTDVRCAWFATEFDPSRGMFFGFVGGIEAEW